MKKKAPTTQYIRPLLISLLIGSLAIVVSTGIVLAAPLTQDEDPTPEPATKDCGDCHLDIANNWSHSPHAHAFDDPVFQDRWTGMGNPGDCLSCHTTNYVASTGEYSAEGVYCEACHGKADVNHPPEVVEIKADTEYCGTCHTTTLSEWKSTGHAPEGVGCMDCHDPHSQDALFKVADDMCINCHQEDMERYLEDLHVQKDIGCVDCHALVIPPEVIPDDGIVPTGHAFNITPATCVACHTDALHAGFSLPGYENGSKANAQKDEAESIAESSALRVSDNETGPLPEQRIQALEAALASRNMATLFQGGVIGLVLGGTTAWIVARNVRRLPGSSDEETEDDEEEG
jgi:predicted CXXCH cytochrome family protein